MCIPAQDKKFMWGLTAFNTVVGGSIALLGARFSPKGAVIGATAGLVTSLFLTNERCQLKCEEGMRMFRKSPKSVVMLTAAFMVAAYRITPVTLPAKPAFAVGAVVSWVQIVAITQGWRGAWTMTVE